MICTARFRSQSIVALTFYAVALLSIGCTSFNGPGDYKYASDYQIPGEDELPPLGSNAPAVGDGKTPRPHAIGSSEEIGFAWPVESPKVNQGFLLTKKRPHWGIDLGGPKGTSILASERGYVVYTGRGFRGYGNLIVIEHTAEWASLYSHLDKISVKEGDYVDRGSVIGTMGRTGRASGVHLHFEIRHNRQPVNPQAYLPNSDQSRSETAALAQSAATIDTPRSRPKRKKNRKS